MGRRPRAGEPLRAAPAAEAAAKVDHVMAAFHSQRERTGSRRDTFGAMLRLRGIECRAPEGLAEAFVCRKFVV